MIPGPWELIVILLIVVVIFGAGRLSQIGGALGKSVREFRQATEEHPSSETPTASVAAPPSVPTPSVSAPVVTDVTCPSCGAVAVAGRAFCGQCGTRVVRAA